MDVALTVRAFKEARDEVALGRDRFFADRALSFYVTLRERVAAGAPEDVHEPVAFSREEGGLDLVPVFEHGAAHGTDAAISRLSPGRPPRLRLSPPSRSREQAVREG